MLTDQSNVALICFPMFLDINPMFNGVKSSLSLSYSFSSSVSRLFFSQAVSVPNTNPFLDDSDVDDDNDDNDSGNGSPGDVTKRSEKKRRAPMPPQYKKQTGKQAISEATQRFPSQESEAGGDSECFGLRQNKRLAPLPPDVSKNRQEERNGHADQSDTPLHSRLQEKEQTNKVYSILQDTDSNTSSIHLSQNHPVAKLETQSFLSTKVKTAKHNKGPAPKPSLQSASCKSSAFKLNSQAIMKVYFKEQAASHIESLISDQLGESSNHLTKNLPVSEEPSTKVESVHSEDLSLKESRQKCLLEESKLDHLGENSPSKKSHLQNIESFQSDVSTKKSRAPLPPAKSDAIVNQKKPIQQQDSTSQPTRSSQAQDEPVIFNSSMLAPSCSTSHTMQTLKTNEVQKTEAVSLRLDAGPGLAHRTLPQARVSPIDVQPVILQNNGGENKRTGDPVLKPCRPHAVKPLNTTDKQSETQDACRSGQITDDTQVNVKVPEVKGTGPYSQLTHDELTKLLEKQKEQLSLKDHKIVELEQYIDNLLVRVMEENPNILMSLCLKKSA